MHHGPKFAVVFERTTWNLSRVRRFFGCQLQEAKVEVTAPPNYTILDELFGLDQAGAWSNESLYNWGNHWGIGTCGFSWGS